MVVSGRWVESSERRVLISWVMAVVTAGSEAWELASGTASRMIAKMKER